MSTNFRQTGGRFLVHQKNHVRAARHPDARVRGLRRAARRAKANERRRVPHRDVVLSHLHRRHQPDGRRRRRDGHEHDEAADGLPARLPAHDGGHEDARKSRRLRRQRRGHGEFFGQGRQDAGRPDRHRRLARHRPAHGRRRGEPARLAQHHEKYRTGEKHPRPAESCRPRARGRV